MKAADAMGKLCEEMRKYWMESATLLGDLRLMLVIGRIGAMLTLAKTVEMLRMAGLLKLAREVTIITVVMSISSWAIRLSK